MMTNEKTIRNISISKNPGNSMRFFDLAIVPAKIDKSITKTGFRFSGPNPTTIIICFLNIFPKTFGNRYTFSVACVFDFIHKIIIPYALPFSENA